MWRENSGQLTPLNPWRPHWITTRRYHLHNYESDIKKSTKQVISKDYIQYAVRFST